MHDMLKACKARHAASVQCTRAPGGLAALITPLDARELTGRIVSKIVKLGLNNVELWRRDPAP